MRAAIASILFAAFLLAPGTAPAVDRADMIIAQMLVGKEGARTDIIRNPQARTLEVRTLDFEGVVVRKDIFRTNAAGEAVACQVFDRNGNLVYRIRYAFDKLGRKTEEGTYNKAGKMVRRAVYGYDANGKQLPARVQTFVDPGRQPIAPIAPQLTPQGKLRQPDPTSGPR
ncbi:MAG: hypothetical protein ACKO2G_16810 [Verrucomicrobiales bacterium]